jgi:hypothetical protein
MPSQLLLLLTRLLLRLLLLLFTQLSHCSPAPAMHLWLQALHFGHTCRHRHGGEGVNKDESAMWPWQGGGCPQTYMEAGEAV